MRLRLAVAALVAAACSSPAPIVYTREQACDWVPITWQRGVMMVDGSLDQTPVTYMVDCGATHVFVDRDAMQPDTSADKTINVAAVGNGIEAVPLEPITIGLGGWKIREAKIAAVDLGPACSAVGTDFAAVAGLPLFARFVIDMDFDHDRLRLIEPGAFARSALPNPSTELPLRLGRLGPEIQCTVEDGAPVWLQIDSGSNAALTLARAFVDEHALLDDRMCSTLWLGGAGGTQTAAATSLRKFAIGNLVWTGVPITAPSSDRPEGVVGRIGMAILRRFRLMFDLPGNRLVLVPRSDWRRPFHRDRAGVAVRLDEGQLQILHVSPGSPAAAAALVVDDRIVAIDGVRITADYWHDQSRWCNGPVGKTVTLELGRGVTVELKLANFY